MKSMRKTTKALIAGAAAVAAVVGVSGSASAANGTYELYRGQTLNIGDEVFRFVGDHWFQLIMQSDGNLVEYRWDGDPTMGQQSRSVCWASNTMGSGADHATYQQDGNFVVYTPGGFAPWKSNTVGGSGSSVDINSAGVVYVGYKAITGGC